MFRKAYVVDTHPEDNSVDLVLCDDGSRLVGVPVFSSGGSARTGGVDLPEVPQASGGNKWDITQAGEQAMEAMVGFTRGGNPFVVGFHLPQISQMTFNDKKRKIYRHQSDVYYTIDGEGNVELYHPSGTYVRIGENAAHDDLENKNFDKSFKLDRNKDKQAKIHLQTKGGKTSITINPDGTAVVKASVNIKCDTPLLIVPNGDVVASGVSLKNHVHTRVKMGTDLSGEPLNGGLTSQSYYSSDGPTASGDGGGTVGSPQENASVVANQMKYVQMKYDEVPAFDPNSTYLASTLKLPADPSLISESLFYEKARSMKSIQIDGVMKNMTSIYDTAAGVWNDVEVGHEAIGKWTGSIPSGLATLPYTGPVEVFETADGGKLAKVAYESKYASMIVSGIWRGSTSVGVDVCYALTNEEYEAGRVS